MQPLENRTRQCALARSLSSPQSEQVSTLASTSSADWVNPRCLMTGGTSPSPYMPLIVRLTSKSSRLARLSSYGLTVIRGFGSHSRPTIRCSSALALEHMTISSSSQMRLTCLSIDSFRLLIFTCRMTQCWNPWRLTLRQLQLREDILHNEETDTSSLLRSQFVLWRNELFPLSL